MVITSIQKIRIFLTILLAIALNAQAELQIIVDGGVEEPTRIAVVPFGWAGDNPLAENVSSIVANDLSRSGMFKLMAQENMLSSPELESQIFFRDWRVSGNDFMLIGSMKPSPSGISATVELYDILTEKS